MSDDDRPGGWTETELATLAALAETFVRGDALRRARLASEALTASADPSQLRQFRLALRLMDSGAANLLLAGRPRSFVAMSPAARERYLLGWATARLGTRRSAFAALRKLLTFLAYADPGADAPNPRLIQMGYRPDDPPVTGDPCPVQPITLPPAWHRPSGSEAPSDGAAFARFEAALAAFDFAPNRGAVFSAHQMGSVRMGADPRTHPCDPWGRVRVAGEGDAVVGGLYVGDGSVFPTGLGVNPMITIMVLARRVARTVLAET